MARVYAKRHLTRPRRLITAMSVEPLAICYSGLAGGTLRGRPTPRFRTIQVCATSELGH
jgi:hypothetical protein